VTVSPGDHSNVEAEINVTCEAGYVMRNGNLSAIARCRTDRRWYPPVEAIHCQPVSCPGTPGPVANSDVTAGNGWVGCVCVGGGHFRMVVVLETLLV